MSDRLTRWLEDIGLGEHATTFAENDIDFSLLARLNADDLKELGLSVGHRRRFLDAAANFERAHEGDSAQGACTLRDEAELRQLTVMFCDLVGSTELSQKMDPEDLREIHRAYQDAARSAIERHGGFVARYMGDGVLAYFGYPQAQEDAAERAVRAGLGVVAVMDELNAGVGHGRGIELAVRVGIATGPVVVGDLIGEGASRESPVVGETPNLAARLQGVAESNTVVIAPGTHRITAANFDYRDLGDHRLKGLASPVRIWQVVRARTPETRFEAARGSGLTPMIGREEELGILTRRWQGARAGEGQVVLVSGEPGIGKSRLTVALREAIGTTPHTRLRYQCSPHHMNSALYPITVQLEHAAGFERADGNAQKVEKLARLLGGSGHAQRADVALLASLLSIPTDTLEAALPADPQQRREQTLSALVRQFEGLAERQPLLCVFEDVHWIDPSTLELLGRLVDSAPACSVLLLMTFRPEFIAPWQGQAHTTLLVLSRIRQQDTRDMVRAIAERGTLSDDVVAQIVEKTDGIPLFVEELTKAMLETDRAATGSSAGSPRPPGPAFAIPTTLQDSLAARLDQLGTAKEVTQIGAVIGREFSFELLCAVSPLAGDALENELAKLVASRLASRRGSGARAIFVFKHALVRDAAYQSLLNKSRRRLHQRVAEALESRFPESAELEPELLAQHYTDAGCLEPALDYWSRAGRRASERSANAEAVAQLEKALEVMAGLPASTERSVRELRLQLALGPMLMAVRGWSSSEVGRAYERARELSVELDQPEALFAALWGLWLFNQTHARHVVAQGFADDILALTKRLPGPDFRLQAHHSAWTTEFFHGDLNAALEHTRRGIELYDPVRHRSHALLYGGHDPGVCARDCFSVCSWLLGYPDQAARGARDVVDLANRVEHPLSAAIAFDCATVISLFRGDLGACLKDADTLIALCTQHRVAQYLSVGFMLRGWALAAGGQADAGLKTFLQGLEAFRTTGGERYVSFYLVLLADACKSAGRVQDGLRVVDEVFEKIERTDERRWSAEAHRLRAELLILNGTQTEEAERCLLEALSIARRQAAKSLELRASISLGRLWIKQNREPQAGELIAAVYDGFTEGFETADLREAKTLLQQLSRAHDSADQ